MIVIKTEKNNEKRIFAIVERLDALLIKNITILQKVYGYKIEFVNYKKTN